MADWSTIAAWWGAGTGTAAILFEVFKYSRSGPRFAVWVAVDAKEVESQGIAGNDRLEAYHYDVSLRVVNRGDEPATITQVVAVHYPSFLRRILRRPTVPLASIPYTLGNGELPRPLPGRDEWCTTINQRALLKKFGEGGQLYIGITRADRRRPLLKRVTISQALAESKWVTF